MIYNIEFNWKEHNVNSEAFRVWVAANHGDNLVGHSANSKMQLHFSEEPSDEAKLAIQDKWKELDDNTNEMCESYKHRNERIAEENTAKLAAKKAAIDALVAVSGLTQEQVKALLG